MKKKVDEKKLLMRVRVRGYSHSKKKLITN